MDLDNGQGQDKGTNLYMDINRNPDTGPVRKSVKKLFLAPDKT